MRITLVLAFSCVAATAFAETRIVTMTDPADAGALQVSLAGRGAELAMLAVPEGELRLDRAASVQRSIVAANAVAGVWIEHEAGSAEVCVLSADGKTFRHAPLPIDDAGSPRVFAAIATSLLDEMLAPQLALPNIDVDVRVDVGQPAPINAAPVVAEVGPDPRELATPGLTAVASPLPEGVVRAHQIQFELGPMLSPMSFGVEGEATVPLAEHLRAGALGGLDVLFTEPAGAVMLGGAEVRYVGSGRKHNDVGVIAGAAVILQGDSMTGSRPVAPFVGLRLQRVWERAGSGLSFSINPVLALTDTVGPKVYPALWTSLRWELPI